MKTEAAEGTVPEMRSMRQDERGRIFDVAGLLLLRLFPVTERVWHTLDQCQAEVDCVESAGVCSQLQAKGKASLPWQSADVISNFVPPDAALPAMPCLPSHRCQHELGKPQVWQLLRQRLSPRSAGGPSPRPRA